MPYVPIPAPDSWVPIGVTGAAPVTVQADGSVIQISITSGSAPAAKTQAGASQAGTPDGTKHIRYDIFQT